MKADYTKIRIGNLWSGMQMDYDIHIRKKDRITFIYKRGAWDGTEKYLCQQTSAFWEVHGGKYVGRLLWARV